MSICRSRRGGLGLLMAGFLTALFSGGAGASPDQLTDHLVLLERLSGQAADEVLGQLQFPPGAVVHVVPEAPSPANWIMAAALQEQLLARGYSVVLPAFGRPPAQGAAPGPGKAGNAAGAGGGQGGKRQKQAVGAGAGAQTGGGAAEGEQETGGEGEQEGREGEQQQEEEQEEGGDQGSTQGVPASTAPADSAQQAPAGGPAAGPPAAESGFTMVLPEQGEVLSFRVVECGISYPWAKRSLLIGPRRFGRMACVRVRASRVTEPGHVVGGVASSDQVHLDSFPGWARSMLEGQEFPFPIQEPVGTPARAILEPVVVAGIVAGLVYLFYENQK